MRNHVETLAIEQSHKYGPKFLARFNMPDRVPSIRAYLHEGGFAEAYKGDLNAAFDYFREIVRRAEWVDIFDGYQFVLAAIWGTVKDGKPERVIDFSGLSDIPDKTWPGNPDIDPWVLREGIYVPEREEKTRLCGDGRIVFSNEEVYRRLKTKNLRDYAENPPPASEILKLSPTF